MPVMMIMEWKGVKPEQYEAARKLVNWEGQEPAGAIFHVASFGDDSLHVTDVWETPQDFDRFVQERLTPGTQKVGIQGQPAVKVFPVHATFVPHPEKLK